MLYLPVKSLPFIYGHTFDNFADPDTIKKTTLYIPHVLLKISLHLLLETTQSDTELNGKEYSLHSNKGLTLKMSALKLFMVTNLHFQLSW